MSTRALRLVPDQAADDVEPRRNVRSAVIDEWGASEGAISIGRSLAGVRWRVDLGGIDRLPRRLGALLVTNPRQLALVPAMVALSIGDAVGRTVRFAGHPDLAPPSLVLRRIGAVLDDPDEVETALRGGDLVVVGARATSRWSPIPTLAVWGTDRREAGTVPVRHVAAAQRAGVAIHPVAAMSSPFARGARVEIGAAVRPVRDRRGPLAAAETADRVQRHLQQRLDEITGGDR